MTPGRERRKIKKAKKPLSFRYFFVLLILMTAIPSLLVLSWIGYNGKKLNTALVRESAADFSAGLALSYSLVDDIATSYMQRMRTLQPVTRLDYARCNRVFESRLAYEYLFDDILLATASGDVLASGRTDTPAQIAPILRTVPVLSEKIYRSEIYHGEPYEEGVIPYVQGLHPDERGNPQFAVVLLLRSAVYENASRKVKPPRSMHYSLIDRKGRIILRGPGELSSDEDLYNSAWQRLGDSDHGSLLIEDTSGSNYYLGFTRLKEDGADEPYMTVFTTLRRQGAFAEMARATTRSVVFVLLCVLCISAAALYLCRKYIILPIEQLVRVTRKFAEGDMSQRAEQGGFSGEIAVLAYAFDEMARAIEQRVRLGHSIEVEVREQANKDFLTGAFNRRAGLSILSNARKLSMSAQSPFAIIFIDLDRFKLINDTYGHAEGDALLKRISGMLTGHLRADDILCRYGGDEFLIVLPQCDRQGVEEAWARIREGVTKLNEDNEFDYNVSLSHGVAVFDPAHPVPLDQLIKTADKLMYFEKEERRDIFRMSEEKA